MNIFIGVFDSGWFYGGEVIVYEIYIEGRDEGVCWWNEYVNVEWMWFYVLR